MRIAFLGDGSLNHVRRWVAYFHERAHEVLLLSFESVDGCPFPAKRFHRRLPTKLLGYLSAIADIRREIDRFHPDLVNALYVGGYGFVAARSGRRPLAVSSLGSDLLVDYPASIVHRLQIRSVLRRADLVITDAEELSRIATTIGADPRKILKAYMGIDEGVFFPPESLPAGHTAAGGRPRVVSTRNLHPIYDVGLLVEAAQLVLRKRDVLFVVCGDGPERGKLEERVKLLGLSGSFVFRGKLEPREIARELRSADVYVSTSRSDSTSVSLLEAMACGAIPVVTDLAANREWITDGENGLIAKGRVPGSLAGAIIEALENTDLRAGAREINFLTVKERGLRRDNMSRV
ncbi:MAG: glycosyltransferase, partial [Candidatus Krumholzibacteria bacterium]|nr:glycosyltransferase [Candidatus Krumholzibacteria bacterium]